MGEGFFSLLFFAFTSWHTFCLFFISHLLFFLFTSFAFFSVNVRYRLLIHSGASFHLIIVFFPYFFFSNKFSRTINSSALLKPRPCRVHCTVVQFYELFGVCVHTYTFSIHKNNNSKQYSFNDGLKVIDWCGCWMHKFKLFTGAPSPPKWWMCSIMCVCSFVFAKE